MKKKNQEGNQEGKQTPAVPKPSNRDIFVFGRLENEVALPVIRRILKLNQSDPNRPINLYINSSGGNGYNADAIIAIMSQIEAKVNTICLGHALSGACEILAAGTGERSAYEFATLMFHQTLWEADGDITNLEIQAAQGQRFRNAQIEVLHRCTGQSRDRLRKDIERDHYMTAEEALEYGLIDRICEHKKKGKSHKASSNNKHEGLDSIAPSAVKAVKQQKVAAALTVRKKAHAKKASKKGRIQ